MAAGRHRQCLGCCAALRQRYATRAVSAPASKRCSTCGEDKLAAAFNVHRTSPSGLQSLCRQCQKVRRPAPPLISVAVASKMCVVCRLEKPRLEFYGKSRARDGLADACQPCANRLRTAVRQRWRARAKEAAAADGAPAT